MEKLRSDKLRYCGIMIQKHVKGWLYRYSSPYEGMAVQ
jgi:hypothetical protein